MANIRKNLSNSIGWTTKRKLIIIESDDWGSIRTSNNMSYHAMVAGGLELNRSNFTRYDCLESNTDLENLFELLSKHKDTNGRSPVFTPMCVVANPNFEKIKQNNFETYFFEPFTHTCEQYPNHDRVHDLWLKGISTRLFVPQFHGREHINVKKWLNALRNGNEGLLLAFKHKSFGASYFKGQHINKYLAAFDPKKEEDIPEYKVILESGGNLFEKLCGYKPNNFVASNSPEPRVLETTLKKIGVKFLTRYKIQRYPLGNNKYHYEINWLGRINSIGQLILTRNCSFEPSDLSIKDSINHCLSEISNAFFWKKPAIISSHRVNYVSSISNKNADNGLKLLNTLLSSILNKWPDVEFLTSKELGEIIYSQK